MRGLKKFESIGIQMQTDAMSVAEANSAFHYSCKVCSQKGVCVECDSCSIKNAHEVSTDILLDMAFERHHQKVLQNRKVFGMLMLDE